MSDESRGTSDAIADGLRNILTELVASSIQRGSVDAARPLIDKVADSLLIEYVQSMREVSTVSYSEGLRVGLERTGTPLQ